jgi:hypothetical protein
MSEPPQNDGDTGRYAKNTRKKAFSSDEKGKA